MTTTKLTPLIQASTTAKVMKSIESIVMLVLVAHCWLCVFTYYDDNNGKISKSSVAANAALCTFVVVVVAEFSIVFQR